MTPWWKFWDPESGPAGGLIAGAVLWFVIAVVTEAFAADFNKRCEAQVIEDFKPLLTKEEWLEVIEAGLAEGAIEEPHAQELRNHVEEVYKTPGYAGKSVRDGERGLNLARFYEALKAGWIQRHPDATPRQYQQAMAAIAKRIGF